MAEEKREAPTVEQVQQSLDIAMQREAAVMEATYVNKMRIEVTEGNMIKVTFAEQSPLAGILIGRASVIMSPENAAALAELIGKFVKQVEIAGRKQ